jgi:pimeloyl-ACP methyl ester carboxylesterase
MNSLQPVYCIAGLGADFRIFEKLRIPNATLYPVAWEEPLKNESLPAYAKRLSTQILHEDAILLGVSFGGMLAIEISRIKRVKQTIIVSSCKQRSEIPRFFRLAGRLGLHHAVPYRLLAKSSKLNHFLFDNSNNTKAELQLKQVMLAESNPAWLRRSVNMIVNWQNNEAPSSLFHIHGRKDLLFLADYVNADAWLEDGTHFMVWNKAEEISRLIEGKIQA